MKQTFRTITILLLSIPVIAKPVPRTDSIQKTATSLVIPVAGHVTGAYGTSFRTDLTIVNHSNYGRGVGVEFYEAGGRFNYGPAFETSVVLPANSTTTYQDVVLSLFQTSGLGTIIINPIESSQPALRLSGNYRNWTPQPGSNRGTLSQSSDALDSFSLPQNEQKAVIIGVKQDADFRCNVGIFNHNYYPRTFRVTASSLKGSVSTLVNLQGYALSQTPLPAADLGYMTVTVEALPGDKVLSDGRWAAYATSVDNRSGDSWIENATVEP